jgi:hypothetical protein
MGRPRHATANPRALHNFKRSADRHDLDQGIGEAYVNTCLAGVINASLPIVSRHCGHQQRSVSRKNFGYIRNYARRAFWEHKAQPADKTGGLKKHIDCTTELIQGPLGAGMS